MSESQDQLYAALARLVNAGADALQSYTKLQEKRAEYFANAASQTPAPQDAAFEQFQPGYFEKAYVTKG